MTTDPAIDLIVATLETDMAAVLEDHLDAPNRCFMVAVTLADCLEDLGFDADVRTVYANSHPEEQGVLGRCWNSTSVKRPKHVILRVEDRYIDVTSRQVGPGFPWVMEVKVDRTPKIINGWEFRYHDMGEYVPSRTRRNKCFSSQLYFMARAIFIATLSRNGMWYQVENQDELA